MIPCARSSSNFSYDQRCHVSPLPSITRLEEPVHVGCHGTSQPRTLLRAIWKLWAEVALTLAMMKHFRRAVFSIIISTASCLPDFSCICEKQNLNACAKTYSCRLNSTLDLSATEAPTWVTTTEQSLFLNTVDDAKDGQLRPPFFFLGRMTWEAKLACSDGDGELQWYPGVDQCQYGTKTSATGTNSTTERRVYHGWASLGFHPLGTEPGTWLTQILGEIKDPDDSDRALMQATCANTGLYVSVSYINASQPYDPRFTSAGRWGVLYAGSHVYPVGSQGVPSYRTDNDLIDNGVSLDCTGYDTTGTLCKQPNCLEPANLTQYQCPAGVNEFPVGAANCSRTYTADSLAESESSSSQALLSLLIAGLLASTFGLWF